MKSIKTRITAVIVPIVILLCAVLGILSCALNYLTASELLKQNISETAVVAAHHVAAEIKAIQNVAIQSGCTARLANSEISTEDKKALIDQTAKKYGFLRGNLLNAQGISEFDGNDYSERAYFQSALKGETVISDPTVSKITGKLSFLVAAPLWENGVPDTKIIGVVYYAPDENFLNDIVSNINVSESGTALLLNKEGTTVADRDAALVSVDNHIEEAKTDPSLAKLAATHMRMIQGEEGYATYRHEGAKWVQGFAPVANTDGWSLGVMAMQKDFLSGFYLSILVTIVVVVCFLTLGIVVSNLFGNQIGIPIKLCVKRLEQLAEGDLASAVPVVDSKDEIGILSRTLAVVTKKLETIVAEVSEHLTKMSKGDFALPDLSVYAGNFQPLSEASNQIVDSFNQAFAQINAVSEQVSSGSQQVSGGAQLLAEGATEQASTAEELTASIVEISEKVHKNAENAKNASILSSAAGKKLMGGNQEMTKLIAAMEDINKNSKEISNIIATINDIASQTNTLALNAAIEAMRAGTAGRGFSVVAEEVRNLASKSAEAAKSTNELINASVQSVQNGAKIADSTANILLEVLREAKESSELVEEIAVASDEQAESIAQITEGIEQISAVIQTNSATAEESAAASEELSGQAQTLESLVLQFKLKE